MDSNTITRALFGGAMISCTALGAAAADFPVTDWPMASGDHANTRYMGLAEITPENVHALRLAFQFATGVPNGHEAAPIVGGDAMYIVTPYPNELYALDLHRRDAVVKWKFEPHPSPHAQGVACCDVVNRGVAYANGRVFMGTLDGQAIAVSADKGEELWRTPLADESQGETVTMAPLVVKDKVLVGNSGGEMGVRGWLTALDVENGDIVWRAWSTGPDADVRIGQDFKPFYATDRGKDLGVSTWPPEAWKHGGGNVWGFLAYDAPNDLVFYGTANPGPWNPEQRPGDNKWTSGVFARRPDSGAAAWFYQWSPHDLHDYDGVNEMVLVDLSIGGRMRSVLLHADRNGYLYVVDRTTGEVLSADPVVGINTSSGVDLANGRLQYNPQKEPQSGRVVFNVCPASPGAKDWQPSAWSPRTQLLYLPLQHLCQDVQTYGTSYIAGTPFTGASVKMRKSPHIARGELAAWDPIARRKRWSIAERFPIWSGMLATAGDLVFYGTMDGWFKAVDARTGTLLWKFHTAAGIVGQPVSYRGPDGHQYIAVLSGVGGWAGSVVSAELDPRDRTAANGFVNAMKDLPGPRPATGMLYVFALP